MTNTEINTIDHLVQDPPPEMGSPPDTTVELIYGLPGIGGRQKIAVVREMTGEDEEHMASLGERTELSYAEYLSQLLRRVVISIGDVDIQKNPSALDSLIVGDRDLLFLGMIKATYGAVREFSVTCRACNQDNTLLINIDKDFPVEGDVSLVERPTEVKLRNGKTMAIRIPTSEDSRVVGKRGKTVAEQNTLMLARCVSSDAPDPESWARTLGVADRKILIDALLALKVGPKVEEVNDPCAHCGETISVVLDWVSLLFG